MAWPGHRFIAVAALLIFAVWAGLMAVTIRSAILPGEATGPMLVAFRPGTPGDEALARITAAGGAPLRATWMPFIWAVTSTQPGLAQRLSDAGALASFSQFPFAPAPAGCVGYTEEEMFEVKP